MNPPNDAARDALEEIIKQHVGQLSEHFENVQIFASNVEQGGDGTSSFTWGSGNWHARKDQAREWVIYHDEKLRARAIRNDEED